MRGVIFLIFYIAHYEDLSRALNLVLSKGT